MFNMGFICNRCMRQLHQIVSPRAIGPRLYTNTYVNASVWSIFMSNRNANQVRFLSNMTNKETLKPAMPATSVEVEAKESLSSVLQRCEQAPYSESSNTTPNIYLTYKLETCNSQLSFPESHDIRGIFDVITAHLHELSPKDVCLAVNRLWESISAAREDVNLLLEYSQILSNHETLPQLCNLIIEHVDSMSTAEALNTLYLLLKFGVPEVTNGALASVCQNLSLRIDSFDLSNAAMFLRCLQSVKVVIPVYDVNCVEGKLILDNVLMHLEGVLVESSEQDSEALCRLLLGLLRCSVPETHHVISSVVEKIYSSIPQLNSSHLSPLSKAIFMMNRHQSQMAGVLTARMSEILDDITSPSEFSHMFFSLIGLCSEDLERRLTEAFMRLYVPEASYGFNDLRRIMQGANIMRSRVNRQLVMSRATELIIPQVPLIPPIELSIIYISLRKVYSRNFELREMLEHRMQYHLHLLDTSAAPNQLLALIEVLSHDPTPDLKSVLIEKAVKVVPHLSAERLGRMCSAAGRMRVRMGKLPAIIEHYVQENIDDIKELTVIKNISQYLASIRSKNSEIGDVLVSRLHEKLAHAVTPSPLVFALDALSILGVPLQDIDPSVWERVKTFMPKLNGNDLRRVFFVLSTYSHHLTPTYGATLPQGLVKLLDEVREPLYAQPSRRSNESNSNSSESKAILTPSMIRDPSSAVAFARTLAQHRVYNLEYLAAIESSVQANWVDLSPFHVRDILDCFACGNYLPKNQDFLDDLCSLRVMPYMSDLTPQRVVDIACHLASLQCFHVELLQTIFNVDFLERIDEEYIPRRLSRQLQDLNRAVCLECPELRVPWFSCDAPSNAGKPPLGGVKLDVESTLQDVLGSPAFFRCNAPAPYLYVNDFECTLDQHGLPVAYNRVSSRRSGDVGLDDEGSHLNRAQRTNHGAVSTLNTQKVAIDVVPPQEMCFNVKRLSSWVEMKRRHLEILGYDYITIPYTVWNSDQLEGTRSKQLYIIELFGGRLHVDNLAYNGNSETHVKRSSRSGKKGDIVDRMLQDWDDGEL